MHIKKKTFETFQIISFLLLLVTAKWKIRQQLIKGLKIPSDPNSPSASAA